MTTAFKPLNPAFKERIQQQLEKQEFMKHIGCVLSDIAVASIVADIELQPFHQQQSGLTHGGVIATIADVAAGFAGFTLIAAHQQLVTVELKTSYYYPVVGSKLRAVGRVLKHGNSLSFCEADIFYVDDFGEYKLCARATATMAIVRPHGSDRQD